MSGPIHTLGVKSGDSQSQSPAMVGGMPIGGGITPQPAFVYRNIFIPLVVNISAPTGSHKATL